MVHSNTAVKIEVAAVSVERMGSGEVLMYVADEARKRPSAAVHTAVEVAVGRVMCIGFEEDFGSDFGEVVVAGQVQQPVVEM